MNLPSYVGLLKYAVTARHKPGAPMLVISSCHAAQDDPEMSDDDRRILYAHAINIFALIHEAVDESGPPMRVP